MSKTRSSFTGCGFLFLLSVFTCTPVSAQIPDNVGGPWKTPASTTVTNVLMDKLTVPRAPKKRAVRRPAPAAGPTAAVNAADAAVRFRSTGTQLKTREIANLIDARNPQLFTLLTRILQEYDKGARAAGKQNDLAMALSFFFATNASVYHDAGEPTDPQLLELRDTIAEALVEGNGLSGVSDRQKQEMYEVLVLYTGLTLATYQEGKGGNAESLKISQQLAGQNLLAITGVSPDNITFTDQGLSIEREPGAANETATQSSAAPARPQSVPAATVNAGKLVIDFEGNEVRANQLYGGKRILINGTVNSIEVLKDGRITLTFHSPAMGYAKTRCYFNKSQSSRLAQFNGGQQAIVEGTVRGLGGGLDGRGYVEIEDCIVP